jgi:hypothetical protein
MNRRETTRKLSRSVEKHINPHDDTRIYWAREVTFDYYSRNRIRVDYMLFRPKNNTDKGIREGTFYCYEVKSSVADFQSKNGHNYVGDYNYYVMPETVFEKIKNKIPPYVGVFVPSCESCDGSYYHLKSVKNARRAERSRTVLEMLLMMFRSAARDRVKEPDSAVDDSITADIMDW